MQTLDEYNDEQRERGRQAQATERRAGGACTRCGTQMRYAGPMQILTSFPPKRAVRCPACGAHGYKDMAIGTRPLADVPGDSTRGS